MYGAESQYKFKVTGFHCEMCPEAVEKAVKNLKGVRSVRLTLIEGKWENGGTLEVTTDGSVNASDVISAIEKLDSAYKVYAIVPGV